MARWREWAVDRFGLEPVRKHALDRRVARSPWYYGDGAALALLFTVLVATGALMTLTYAPTPDAAYESVTYITNTQTLGWFIRALHYWCAGLMVVMLFFHLFRQILVAGYKFPREGTWLIGVLLFFGVFAMAFSGYVLRWDERSIYALRVSLHILSRVPLIGEHIVVFVQGGPEQGARTLTRFYSLHVIFLPLALIALITWHVYLVILHGVTSRGERRTLVHTAEEQKKLYKAQAHSEKEGEQFYPETTAKSGGMAIAVFTIAVLLALFVGPQDLMPKANLVEPAHPAEEWWFWWISGLIALLPPAVAPAAVLLIPILLFLALVALPLLDRGPKRGMSKRPVAVIVVLISAAALIYLSDLRRRSPWTAWPTGQPPHLPDGVTLPPEAELGRQLFARYGCNSCHSVADRGRSVGPDLGRAIPPRTREGMRDYILRPPPDVPMPPYEGRITDDDLERILDYLMAAQGFPRQ